LIAEQKNIMSYQKIIDATGIPQSTYYHYQRTNNPFFRTVVAGIDHMHKVSLSFATLADVFRQQHTQTLAEHCRQHSDPSRRRLQRWFRDPRKRPLLQAYIAGVIHGNS
jgi:hypothetical protein